MRIVQRGSSEREYEIGNGDAAGGPCAPTSSSRPPSSDTTPYARGATLGSCIEPGTSIITWSPPPPQRPTRRGSCQFPHVVRGSVTCAAPPRLLKPDVSDSAR